jgi:hypothetical protein
MVFDPSSKELNYTKDLLNSTYNPNENSFPQNSQIFQENLHNHIMQMYPIQYQRFHNQSQLFMNDTMFENFNNNNINNTNINLEKNSLAKEKNISSNSETKVNLMNPNIISNQNPLPPFMPPGNLMPPHPMFLGRNMNMVFPQPFPGAQNIFPQNINMVTEPLEINNIFLFNIKFDIPNDKSVWYIYNHIQSMTSLPISSIQLFDLYNMKIINGEVDVRPIDIFQFAEQMPFSFVKLKVINDINWIERIIDNQLLKYTELFSLSAKIKGEFSEKHKYRKLSNRKSSHGSYSNKNNNKEYEKLVVENNNNNYNYPYRNEEEVFEVVGKKKKSKNENILKNNNNNRFNDVYTNANAKFNTNNNNVNQIQNKNTPQTQNINLNQKPLNKQKINSNINPNPNANVIANKNINTNTNSNNKPVITY